MKRPKETIKSDVFLADENGNLKILLFDAFIIKESNHIGRLKDGRPVVMQLNKLNHEVWYIPYKYQKGER